MLDSGSSHRDLNILALARVLKLNLKAVAISDHDHISKVATTCQGRIKVSLDDDRSVATVENLP